MTDAQYIAEVERCLSRLAELNARYERHRKDKSKRSVEQILRDRAKPPRKKK